MIIQARWKFAEYEMKGVPVRIAIGARDLENNVVEVARRDTKGKKDHFYGWACSIYQKFT